MKKSVLRFAVLLVFGMQLFSCTNLWGALDNPTDFNTQMVPANLSAVAGDGQVLLSWSPVAGASSYSIYRSMASGDRGSRIGSSSTTSYTDTSVLNGAVYYYEVTTLSSKRESAPSIQVGATPMTPTLVPDIYPWTTSIIELGKTVQLEAVVSVFATPVQNVAWSTSDASIATVSSTGLVTGVACGAATVTWTSSDGGSSGVCTIRVKTYTVLSSDTTWSGFVTLAGDVSISGCTLTILPGTIVNIAPGIQARISVNDSGKLYAHGNPGNVIVFKAASPISTSASAWEGLGHFSGTIDLSYCIVEDAFEGISDLAAVPGGAAAATNTCFINCEYGVVAYSSPTAIRYVTFDNCMRGYRGVVPNDISYVSFNRCSMYGVVVDGSKGTTSFNYSNFISNGTDAEVFTTSANAVVLNLTGCYPASLTTYIDQGTDTSSSVTITDGSFIEIPTAGCGFDYSSLVTPSVSPP